MLVALFADEAFDTGEDVLAGAYAFASKLHDILGIYVDTNWFHSKKIGLTKRPATATGCRRQFGTLFLVTGGCSLKTSPKTSEILVF